ncbi:hypothetical protein F5Y15DRAFT_376150 [Xylariaceae sp. FL0016]|nr:hypothetical protein F5Y15DRAFT_376150 [Xylariaceae sp. FL0016]
MFADVRNEPPPLIATVCHDARQAVLRRYRPVVFSGIVKHLDLSQDILLLDSYLQVRRLLKVIRLLSQIETVRRNVTKLALGTSWGLQTGLHLRLFHKTVQTKKNMARLLNHISRFQKLKSLILVVYQRSAVSPRVKFPDHRNLPWSHHDLLEPYYFNFNVNFDHDNYWIRRPYQKKLIQISPDITGEERVYPVVRHTKHCPHCDPQPRGPQVHDLKATFESWLKKLVLERGHELSNTFVPPNLETATLTWIYTGKGHTLKGTTARYAT